MPENLQYSRLFQAKVLTLLATGLATIELSVIAVNIAGQDASALLGTALSLKSLSFVVAPFLMAAVIEHLPRGRFLVVLDLLRAVSVFSLIFVSSQLCFQFVIALFLAASAAFKVTYFEYVAHLLPDRSDFATAMSKSRIVDELEGAVSPIIAAVLLLVLPMDLFLLLTALAFVLSAVRTGAARLPDLGRSKEKRRGRRRFAGAALFLSDSALRPLTWLMVSVAAGTAMVMTNTPALVEAAGDLGSSAIAAAFGAFGLGAIAGAVAAARLARSLSERAIVLAGAVSISTGLLGGVISETYVTLILLWSLVGAGVTLVQTPAAAVIRNVTGDRGLITVYGSGLAIQNVILVFAYSLAGWLAAEVNPTAAFLTLALVSSAATAMAWHLWRMAGPDGTLTELADEYRVLWSWMQVKRSDRGTEAHDGR